jgi:hypothetical protein
LSERFIDIQSKLATYQKREEEVNMNEEKFKKMKENLKQSTEIAIKKLREKAKKIQD